VSREDNFDSRKFVEYKYSGVQILYSTNTVSNYTRT
jgi:hypothetical protein